MVLKVFKEFLKDLLCRWRRSYVVWRLTFRPVAAESVLVVAPHPDDESFGCGNIIALKKQLGAQVLIVFLTDGETSLKDHSSIALPAVAAVRKQESVEACAHLGLNAQDLKRYSLPDGKVPRKGSASFEPAVERLMDDIMKFAPAEIICPHPLDGHGDHAAAAEIALEAIRNSGSTARLLYYTVWLWFTRPWGPHHRLDVSSAWKVDGRTVHAQKLKAINTYLDHLEPGCGVPYCGKLHPSVIFCARQCSELLFEQLVIRPIS